MFELRRGIICVLALVKARKGIGKEYHQFNHEKKKKIGEPRIEVQIRR